MRSGLHWWHGDIGRNRGTSAQEATGNQIPRIFPNTLRHRCFRLWTQDNPGVVGTKPTLISHRQERCETLTVIRDVPIVVKTTPARIPRSTRFESPKLFPIPVLQLTQHESSPSVGIPNAGNAGGSPGGRFSTDGTETQPKRRQQLPFRIPQRAMLFVAGRSGKTFRPRWQPDQPPSAVVLNGSPDPWNPAEEPHLPPRSGPFPADGPPECSRRLPADGRCFSG